MMRWVVAGLAALAIMVALDSPGLAQVQPEFKLGFKALADQIPEIAGVPLEDEHWGANGDSLQQTTTGLMAWRKADNWTAFTNGSQTWVNGPAGVQSRPNTERFEWERDSEPESQNYSGSPAPAATPSSPAPTATPGPSPFQPAPLAPRTDWFMGPGAVPSSPITGFVDGVTAGAGDTAIVVSGWAVDHPRQPREWYYGTDFMVFVDGLNGSGGQRIDVAGTWERVPRPDVASATGEGRNYYAGFKVPADISSLSPGNHMLYLYVYGPESGWWIKPVGSISVQSIAPPATATPRPGPSPTPTPRYFTADPYGPVKVEPRTSFSTPLYVEKGVVLWVRFRVGFTSSVPSLAGEVPTIGVSLKKGDTTLMSNGNVGDGSTLRWTSPESTEYTIVLDNTGSPINAKLVTLEFLPR